MNSQHAYILIQACIESLDQAAKLLDAEPDLLNEKTGLGETPLHYLAVKNHLEAVKFLFERGAEINTLNECNGSPLSEAATLGYLELVKFLIANGARINGTFGIGEAILHEAVSSGNPEIVELLIQNGADIQATNSLGETPLHKSSKDDAWLEVTKLLVNCSAAVDAMAAFDSTPLNGAALHGCINTAKYLVSAGASLSLTDSKGLTPAQMAYECNHIELYHWLKEAEQKTKHP